MVRSLIAVIIAVIFGLAVANGFERVGLAWDGLSPIGFDSFLLAGWGTAAFVAAIIALLIGRKWAPLGWLAAAAMVLFGLASSAVMALPASVLGGIGWITVLTSLNVSAQTALPGPRCEEKAR